MSFTFASDSRGNVVLPAAAAEPVRFAARELVYYVGLLTGACPSLIEGDQAVSGPGPSLTLGVDTAAAGSGPGPAGDGALLRVAGERAELLGGTPFGLIHGIYRLLERFGGAYWVNRWEADETLPRLPRLEIPNGEYRWLPRFSCRAFTNYPDISPDAGDFVDWMAKRGYNHYVVNPSALGVWEDYLSLLREPLALRGMTASLGHHTLPFWLPPEETFASHPEYFALIDGERRPDGQLCLSAPEVPRLIAERIVAFLRANPQITEVGLWPRDGYGWCQCPACEAAEAPEPSWWSPDQPRRTDSYLRFVNAVAERVGEEVPEARLTALAYLNYVDPPRETQPLSNVVVYFAAFQRCLRHSLDDPACVRRNPTYREFLERWRELTPGELRVFLYTMQIDTFSLPYRITQMLPPYFDFLTRAGVDGWMMEYIPAEWCTFAANAYLISELAWTGDSAPTGRSGEDLLAPYYESVYGPAAQEMASYYRALVEDFVQTGPCTGHYDLSYAQRATPGLLRRALEHLGRSRALAAEERAAWRAVQRAHIAAELLLRTGAWQRALVRLDEANDFTRPRLMKLAEEEARSVLQWAEAHQDDRALEAPKIRRRIESIHGPL